MVQFWDLKVPAAFSRRARKGQRLSVSPAWCSDTCQDASILICKVDVTSKRIQGSATPEYLVQFPREEDVIYSKL